MAADVPAPRASAADRMPTRTLKFKCPYCRQIFGYQHAEGISRWRTACPHCRRMITLPPMLRPLLKVGKRDRGRGRRAAEPLSPRGTAILFTALTGRPRFLIGVVVVTVILSALFLPRAQRAVPAGPRAPTKEERALENLRVLRTALELFRFDCERYPTTEETLKALVRDPGIDTWQKPYIDALKPDPWMTPYVYAASNDTVALSSNGPDGRPGTADDIAAPPPDFNLLNGEANPGAHLIPIP
jgi:general secretion pathway protein G